MKMRVGRLASHPPFLQPSLFRKKSTQTEGNCMPFKLTACPSDLFALNLSCLLKVWLISAFRQHWNGERQNARWNVTCSCTYSCTVARIHHKCAHADIHAHTHTRTHAHTHTRTHSHTHTRTHAHTQISYHQPAPLLLRVFLPQRTGRR